MIIPLTFYLLLLRKFKFHPSEKLKMNHRNQETLTDVDIQELIDKRIKCRMNKDFNQADEIKYFLQSKKIEIFDFSYKSGGGSTWKFVNASPFQLPQEPWMPSTLMEFAHECYNLKSNGYVNDEMVSNIVTAFLTSSFLVESGNSNQVSVSIKQTVQGRKFADIAFELAMAGIKDNAIFNQLVMGAKAELLRFGLRSSCRVVDILQIAEKMAVAGVRDESFYTTITDILNKKTNKNDNKDGEIKKNKKMKLQPSFTTDLCSLSLLSDRPLLWLWRYSSRQRKSGNQMKHQLDPSISSSSSSSSSSVIDSSSTTDIEMNSLLQSTSTVVEEIDDDDDEDDDDFANANKKSPIISSDMNIEMSTHSSNIHSHSQSLSSSSSSSSLNINLQKLFKDPSLPLVVDLGCGFGVSLLGLASTQQQQQQQQLELQQQLLIPSKSFPSCDSDSSSSSSSNFNNDNDHKSHNNHVPSFSDPHANVTIINSTMAIPATTTAIPATTTAIPNSASAIPATTTAIPTSATATAYNFLGCDMSSRAIAYAEGVASRWGISYVCAFIVCDAETCLDLLIQQGYYHNINNDNNKSNNNNDNNIVDTNNNNHNHHHSLLVPYQIAWFCVNFPTPYNINTVLALKEDESVADEDSGSSNNNDESIHANTNNNINNSDNNHNDNIKNANNNNYINNNNNKLVLKSDQSAVISSTTTSEAVTAAAGGDGKGGTVVGGGEVRGGGGGNNQLPKGMSDFMLTSELVRKMLLLLHTSKMTKSNMNKEVVNISSSSSTLNHDSQIVHKDENHNHNHTHTINDDDDDDDIGCGYIYLQSNVEDVAVTMRHIVESTATRLSMTHVCVAVKNDAEMSSSIYHTIKGRTCNSNAINATSSMSHHQPPQQQQQQLLQQSLPQQQQQQAEEKEEDQLIDNTPPQAADEEKQTTLESNPQRRKLVWAAAGGTRATGSGYLHSSPLPTAGRTETEAACEFEGKPVYRILFRVKK